MDGRDLVGGLGWEGKMEVCGEVERGEIAGVKGGAIDNKNI